MFLIDIYILFWKNCKVFSYGIEIEYMLEIEIELKCWKWD